MQVALFRDPDLIGDVGTGLLLQKYKFARSIHQNLRFVKVFGVEN